MNKTTILLTVRPHSTVDLITNSSSEIFTCDYGHSLKTVRDIVRHVYDLYHRDFEGEWGPEIGLDEEDGAIRIKIDFYTVPFGLIELLREVFETHETT